MTLAGDMLLWKSSKDYANALSSTETEFCASSMAQSEVAWLHLLARDWHIAFRPTVDPALPFHRSNDQSNGNAMPINFDKQDSITMARAGHPTSLTKHIDLAHCSLVAEVDKERLSLVYILTSQQKAAFQTKTLTKPMRLGNIDLTPCPN